MRKNLLLLSLVLGLSVAGCRFAEVAEDEGEEGPRQPVEIQAAAATLETLHPVANFVGVLVPVPERVAYVAAQKEGQVERIVVQEGQAVKAGDLVVELDKRVATVERARAQAGLDEANAALALLQRGPLPQEIEAAQQEAQTAAATADGLRAKLEALKPLSERKEVSPVQYQQAQAALKAAEAEQAAAEARLKLVRSGARTESVTEAKAKAASAEAELAGQDLAVNLSTLTSPIDGTVTELTARQGMTVQPSDKLATVMDLSTVFARFRLPAGMFKQVGEGTPVQVSLDADNATATGTVARVGKVADPQTGDVEAFASLPNPDGLLKPGLGCRIHVSLPDVQGAVVVPAKAVADHDGTQVVTAVRENKAYETEVSVGARTADAVQILNGLAAGDTVALEGGYGLPDGCPVVAKESEKAPARVE